MHKHHILFFYAYLTNTNTYPQIIPYELFENVSVKTFEDDILTESLGTKKKNIFEKIFEILKRCWKWITDSLGKFINSLKKFLGFGKTKRRDIDSVALSVLKTVGMAAVIPASSYAATKGYINYNKQEVHPLSDDSLDNIANDAKAGKVGKYKIAIEYDNGNSIRFNILSNGLDAMISNKSYHGERLKESIAIIFKCLKSPEVLDGIIMILQEIKHTLNH